MTRHLLPLFLVGLLSAGPAFAQAGKEPARKVLDEAGLFSKEAVQAANDEIARIKKTFKKDLLIETRETAPAKSQDELGKWATARAREFRVEGVYVVITQQPKRFQVVVGKETRDRGWFTHENVSRLGEILKTNLGKDRDEALKRSVSYVQDTFRQRAPADAAPAKKQKAAEVPPAAPARGNGGGWLGGLGGLLCVGVVVLLGVWLIFGLIRGIGGAMGGGYGPGFGGGGFFSSLLGGLFGAAVGMWAYNHFFGGDTPTTQAGENLSSTADASQPSDVESGYSSEGGDWGDNDPGGGDAGGGDWGGGGDFGGGGDW